MPTLCILNSQNQEHLHALPIHQGDYLLLTDVATPCSTLYKKEFNHLNLTTRFIPQGYIYDSDKSAQAYLAQAQRINTPEVVYARLDNPQLKPYIKMYARPRRVYICHTLPLDIGQFQVDDLILTLGLPTQRAQIARIENDPDTYLKLYVTDAIIIKTSEGYIHDEAFDIKLKAIRNKATTFLLGYIEEADAEYDNIYTQLLEISRSPSTLSSNPPSPNKPSTKKQPQLSNSGMGLGFQPVQDKQSKQQQQPGQTTEFSH